MIWFCSQTNVGVSLKLHVLGRDVSDGISLKMCVRGSKNTSRKLHASALGHCASAEDEVWQWKSWFFCQGAEEDL